MRITAEDTDGGLIELTAGTDFSVTATPTEAGTDLEIKITKLGSYSYELKYNALWDEYARLDRWLTEHRPETEADLTDEYARNLKARELISERIDEL